jgi:hypothetical protein
MGELDAVRTALFSDFALVTTKSSAHSEWAGKRERFSFFALRQYAMESFWQY